MQTFKIQPCILVLDRLTVDRAVTYMKKNEEVEVAPDGSEHATWQAERFYKNRDEATKATSTYAAARNRIRSVCIPTDIGFVCPASQEADLVRAIEDAKKLVDDANASFTFCHVNFRVVCTRIEPSNTDGVDMLRETLELRARELREALTNFDPRRAQEVLRGTKGFVDVLADPAMRDQLVSVREQTKELVGEIAKLIKEFDGNIQNAMASNQGKAVLSRVNAPWNF